MQRILIITKFRFIGDTLVATPILRAARRRWPSARIVLLTGRNARRLLEHNPYLDEIVEFDPVGADSGLANFGRIVRRMRAERFDLALVLNRSFHSALIPRLAGARLRAGFTSEGRSLLLNRRAPYDNMKSEIDCYFDVVRKVAPDIDADPGLELWVSDEERRGAAERLRGALGADPSSLRLIGIQPGASLPIKRWEIDRFVEVAEALLVGDGRARLVLIGGPDEVEAGRRMWEACSPAVRERAASFVGACDLRGSLGVVSHLDLFIGADTAIMHSAVALGAATVALFGPTNPKKWGNHGPRQRVLHAPEKTMHALTVAEVLRACDELAAAPR